MYKYPTEIINGLSCVGMYTVPENFICFLVLFDEKTGCFLKSANISIEMVQDLKACNVDVGESIFRMYVEGKDELCTVLRSSKIYDFVEKDEYFGSRAQPFIKRSRDYKLETLLQQIR